MKTLLSVGSSATSCLRSIYKHRWLAAELAKRDVADRYAGQMLGTIWAVVHPLTTILVFIFVFAVVFRTKLPSSMEFPSDYTIYMLSGLIPWMVAIEVIVRAPTAIVGQSNLVKQVIFPVEVLPVKIVGASLPLFLIGIAATIGYSIYAFGFEPIQLLLLVAGVMLYTFLLGVAFLLAAVSVFVRDIASVVQVYAIAGLYLAPVFYFIDWVPAALRPVLYLNPMTLFIECFHDIAFRGTVTPALWLATAAMSVAMLCLGAAVFNWLKPQFGTFL